MSSCEHVAVAPELGMHSVLLRTYIQGNQTYPQMEPGIMGMAGSRSTAMLLAGRITVAEFAAMGMTDTQLDVVNAAAISAHRRFGIPCRPARSAAEAESDNMHHYGRQRLAGLASHWIGRSLELSAQFAISLFPGDLPAIPADDESNSENRRDIILQAAEFLFRRDSDTGTFRPEAVTLGRMWQVANHAIGGAACRSIARDQRQRMRFMYALSASDLIWETSVEEARGVADRIRPYVENAVMGAAPDIRAGTGTIVPDGALRSFFEYMLVGVGAFHRPVELDKPNRISG